MKKVRICIFILAILLTLGLAACTRSASQPSTLPPEEGDVSGTESGTQEPMGVLEEMATQTAAAQEATGEDVEEPGGEEGTTDEEAAPEEDSQEGGGGEDEEAAPTEEPDDEVGGGQDEPEFEPEEYEVPNTYVIKKGDHLYCIARRFDINVSTLLNVNGFGINSNVYPGTKLTIPKDAGGFVGNRALRSHPTNYTVVAGDTINSIACLFGDVDPRAIEAANDLGSNYSLNSGQVLRIP